MIGETYYERGEPVKVLVAWRRNKRPGRYGLQTAFHPVGARSGGPRNVLIQRADGSVVVRPFRGLRKKARA